MASIVVTGLGIFSPLGIGSDAVADGLLRSSTGIELLPLSYQLNDRYWLVANVKDFDPKAWVAPRKSIKLMSRETQLGFAAAVAAYQHAGMQPGAVSPDRLGVLFGSSLIFSEFLSLSAAVQACRADAVFDPRLWGEKMRSEIDPLWLLRSLPNMPACHVGIALDARGPCNSITVEETSGLCAIAEAAQAIRQGKADVMVVGACSARTHGTRLLQRHEALFTKAKQPEKSCRPFDRHRDGTVPAEGAAACILESASFARRRGANILATLHAWGNRFAAPAEQLGAQPKSVRAAVEATLNRGNLDRNEIDFVLGSANGSIPIDRAEAQGMDAIAHLPITSLKSRFGDAACASGLIDFVATIIALQRGFVPHTLFHEQTAEDCPCEVISQQPRSPKSKRFLQLSTSPHGHCAALLASVHD